MKIRLVQTHRVIPLFSYSSLTDIVLLLLVFFLLTSSFIATRGITVKLPEAENVRNVERNHITVTLLRDGRILIDDVPSAVETLNEDLGKALTAPAEQVIVLSSDKEVPLERAVRVLDVSRGLGASRFFISTASKDEADDTRQ